MLFMPHKISFTFWFKYSHELESLRVYAVGSALTSCHTRIKQNVSALLRLGVKQYHRLK